MPWAALTILLLRAASAMADPLTDAEDRFNALDSYQAVVRSVAADGERQVMRYYYRRPGWVRIEMITPHDGVVLIYDPAARRVRLWPFGVGTLPLSLAPDNRLVRGARGHRVDRSDVGALLDNVRRLRTHGRAVPLGAADIGGRPAIGVEVEGDGGASIGDIHRYRVWLAQDSLFPLRVESFDAGGGPIETVDMTDVELGVALPDRLFTP